MNKEKSLYAIIGLLMGLIIGYFGTNSLNGSAPTAQTSPSAPSASLPADHPQTGQSADAGASAGAAPTGDVMAAIEQARKDPSNFEAQLKAAELFRQINRREGELEFYERAAKIKPNDFDLLIKFGEANLELGRFDEAIKHYEQALKSNPRHEVTLQNLALAFIEKGDKAGANAALKRLEQVNPRNPQIAPLRSRTQ